MALSGKDKHIVELALELSKVLKEHQFEKAWTNAGELNALLKNTEDLQLNPEVIESIKKDLNSYYFMNREYKKVTNRAYAIACSFERSASI
jgi:putative transfer protein